MNPQLQYLNRLVSIKAITPEDYYNRLGLAYRNSPTSFNEDDVDFMEKTFKEASIPFNRDMKAAEANLGSTLNQFVSGLAEGFTTLGWAEDPDTTTESIANKVGHLVGLAPDVIMGVLSMGAAVPGIVGKRAVAKGAVKTAARAGLAQEKIVGASQAYESALSATAKRLKIGNFNLAKNVEGKTYLRSVPMKIADIIVDNAKKSMGKNNLLTSGFFNKGILGSKRFRETAEQGIHLGVGLGVSAWKEGPKGMAEAGMHGAMAGAVFGGVAQYVDIAKLMGNPATAALGKQAVKNTVNKMSMEQMQAINVGLRGTIGSAYTGITAQKADLPLPEVVYEYLLGFFFGASGTRKGEIQRRRLLFDKDNNSRVRTLDNLEVVDKEVKKTKEYQELEPQDKAWWENYKETLYDQQVIYINAKRTTAANIIFENVKNQEGNFNKDTLKEFNKKQMESEEIKDSGLSQEQVGNITKDSIEIQKEFSKEKDADLINEQFNIKLEEAGELRVKLESKDLTDEMSLGNSYTQLTDSLLNIKPELTRTQVQQKLRKAVKDSKFDIDIFNAELSKEFNETTVKQNSKELKKYFYRKKYHANHKELMVITEYGDKQYNILGIGSGEKEIEVSKKGDDLTVPQTQNKENKMFGGIVRKVIQYIDRFIYTPKGQKGKNVQEHTTPLEMKFGEHTLGIDIILNEINKKVGDNWYIQGANKDNGTLVLHQHGVKKGQVKEVLNVVQQKKYGIMPEKGFERETASNIVWDLRRNGLLEKDFTKQDLETAMDIFIDPANGFTTNLVKWNKYQPLSSGMDLPLEAKDFKSLLSEVVEGSIDITMYSGAAAGADKAWAEAARKQGHKVKEFIAGQAGPEVDVFLNKANETLKRNFNGQPLLRRNYLQVKDSDMVLAVSELLPGNKIVKGGTAWAVQMGIDKGIPVEVFNQKDNTWYKWNGKEFEKQKSNYVPTPTPNYTGIGTRGLSKQGKAAIDKVVSRVQKGTEGQIDGFFNMITAKDGKISEEILKKFPEFNADTATDGVLYFRNDVMDRMLDVFGFDKNIGFVKPVGFIRPRNGKGNILLKVGGFRPSEKLNQYMVDNNIHMIAYESGVKSKGNVKFSDLDYNSKTKQWETTETPEVLKVRPDEIGINVDVYEKIESGNIKVMKGVFDKNTSIQFSPEYWETLDRIRSIAKRGDSAVNELVGKSIADKTTIAQLDIDKVSLKLINDILEKHLDKPIAKQVLKEIFNKGNKEDYQVLESYEIDGVPGLIENSQVVELLNKSNSAFTFMTSPRFQPYIQKTIRNYMAARVVRFNVENGFKAKLYGYDKEIYTDSRIGNDQFMLSEGHKKDLIRVEGQEKPMTLDAAFREYQRLQKYKVSTLKEKDLQRFDALEEALTYLIARAPISGNGGVRALRFNGFVKRKGFGMFTNEYNDYYLGGADKDADAVHAYQSIDKVIKKEFAKPEIQKELEDGNKFINIKDKKIGKDLYGVETGESYTLNDLFSPRKRLEIGYMAHQGKKQMGEIVNAGVNMINLFDIASRTGGRIDVGKLTEQGIERLDQITKSKAYSRGEIIVDSIEPNVNYSFVIKGNLKDLVRDVYNGINWMADSAEISKVFSAKEALSRVFNKHFNIRKANGEMAEVSDFYFLKHFEGYGAFKNFRDSLFGYKANTELKNISERAEHFLEYFGSREGSPKGFLEGLAKQYKNISLEIDPFKYYNKKDVVTMLRRFNLELANNPLLKDLDILDTYSTLLSPKELDLMIESDAFVYQRAQDVIGMQLAINQAGKVIDIMTRNGISQEKATRIMSDMVKKTYDIKQDSYERNKEFKEKRTNNINRYIFLHKQAIKDAITKLGGGAKLKEVFRKEIDTAYDFFLIANPISKDGMKNRKEMKFAEINQKEIKEQIKKINEEVETLGDRQSTPRLEKLYSQLNYKIGRYSGRVDSVMQSPLVEPSSIKKFYASMDKLFDMSKKIKSDETPNAVKEGRGVEEVIAKERTSRADQIEQTTTDLIEAMPVVDGIKIDLEKTKMDILSKKDINPIDIEFLNTMEIIKDRPGYIDYIGNMFLEFQQNFLSKAGKVNEVELRDLQLFNKYLKDLMGAEGSIFKQIEKSKKNDGPKGKHHILFFGQAEKAMRSDIQKRLTDVMVTDKNGNVAKVSLKVPTTTLTKNLEAARFFHRLDNRLKVVIQERMQEEFKFLNKDDANIQRGDFDAIFTAVVFEKQMRLYDIQQKITDQGSSKINDAEQYVYSEYKKSQKVLKKLKDSNTIYKLIDPKVKGEFKDTTPQELFNRIDKSITTLLTQVKNDIIVSKHPLIKDILIKEGKKVNEFKPEKELTKDDPGFEIQELNKLLLDKNGIMSDMSKVDILYKKLLETEVLDPLNIVNKMFSLTDARYIEYQKGVSDMIIEKFPNINLQKLNKSQVKLIKEYKKFLEEVYPYEKNISIGRFESPDGMVRDYFPQLGQYNIKSNWPKLKEYVENNIEGYRKGIVSSKDLPGNLRRQYDTGLLSFPAAKALAVEARRQMLDRMRITGLSGDLATSEVANSSILSTRPQNWLQQTTGNLKSRSADFMPFYDTSVNALDMYMGSVYRNYIDVVRNIRVDNNIRRFEKEKPFGEFTPNWSAYMRDAHNNIAGYPSLRNFDLHGIKQKELSTINRYIESDLDFVKMKATNVEKRFLQDMQEQLGLTALQQHKILQEIKKPGKQLMGPELTKEALKENYKELAQSKNVNKINRFGTAYQVFSDEALVNVAERFNDAFGGNLFKNAPKEGKARRFYLANKFKNFSTLEGKFEMLSLLSHPKTAITNFYGGFTNTISDVGWEAFRQASSSKWLLSNAFPNAEYFSVNSKGKRIKQQIKSKEDINRFMAELGVFEDMFIQEAFYSSRLSKINSKRFLNELARRLNGKIKEGELSLENEANYNKVQKQTLKEVAKEFGILDNVVEKGAFFMRRSEMILRSTTWLANYIQGRNLFIRDMGVDLAFNDPMLLNYASKGVKASQFIYHAAERPNFSNTSLGRVMTRFHPYAWNSIKRRIDIYKGAGYESWKGGLSTQKAQRQFTADVMALSLASIFTASIFEYALSPPMSWMQDTASLIFGDEKARDRAFFSQYPIPALAPLSIVTPPIGRFVLSPLTSIINGNWDDFYNYQLYTYFPFGRLGRDLSRTAKSPAMFLDFMTGIPQHQIHSYTRDMISDYNQVIDEEENTELD